MTPVQEEALEYCPIDGSVRLLVERGEDYVVARCPWCRTVTREQVEVMA